MTCAKFCCHRSKSYDSIGRVVSTASRAKNSDARNRLRLSAASRSYFGGSAVSPRRMMSICFSPTAIDQPLAERTMGIFVSLSRPFAQTRTARVT